MVVSTELLPAASRTVKVNEYVLPLIRSSVNAIVVGVPAVACIDSASVFIPSGRLPTVILPAGINSLLVNTILGVRVSMSVTSTLES